MARINVKDLSLNFGYKVLFDNLSIGCRRKTQLAKIIAEGANILLLDEPTNHLDLVSLEQIEEQLLSFSGIVIAVSHDRYFIKKIATKVLRIEMSKKIS
ncbi:MAG: Nucleotide-binding protein ExpZ [Mycoplasmataceae bacterium]|nr:MAG: Nucleotide-binding protein ExpZ [Mycoplasmataceae bacterium]